MQIKITGHKTKITAPLRDYVHEKVGKLEEYFNNIQKIEVVLDARDTDDADKRQVAEIRAWLAGKKVIQAQEAGRDMYAAIDLAVEEAKRQIQRHKSMHVKEQRRKGSEMKHQLAESSFAEEDSGPVLVKLDRFSSKPMNPAEAQAELKLSEQDFLTFRNSENDEINVIRKNGKGVELLRPERDLLPDEAVSELKKTQQELIIFNNRSSRIPAVVFRRKSGNFGLIEPEA
jgi:putative sigma-54 modulation protein